MKLKCLEDYLKCGEGRGRDWERLVEEHTCIAHGHRPGCGEVGGEAGWRWENAGEVQE